MPVTPSMPVPSPKGNVRLHPAEERQDGPPFCDVYDNTRNRLDEDLEEMRMKNNRLKVIAMRLAYHVTKTPQDFMTDDSKSDDQLWSVMPDAPNSSPQYKPVSRHKTRDEAVRALKKLEESDLSKQKQEKEEKTDVAPSTGLSQFPMIPDQSLQQPSNEETDETADLPPPVDPVVRAKKPLRMQTNDKPDLPPPVDPVIRAKPPQGMTPEQQAEDIPQKRTKASDKPDASETAPEKEKDTTRRGSIKRASCSMTAGSKRKWQTVQQAASEAWSRR